MHVMMNTVGVVPEISFNKATCNLHCMRELKALARIV